MCSSDLFPSHDMRVIVNNIIAVIEDALSLAATQLVVYAKNKNGLNVKDFTDRSNNLRSSISQSRFLSVTNELGYQSIVCYSSEDAIEKIKEYLKNVTHVC